MELFINIKKKLQGFSLDVQFDAGLDALGLLGASGAGKSMTLRCIAGLDKPDKGRIVLNGHVLFDSEKGINIPCRKRKTGFLFQNYALFPKMTVEENIGFALGGLDKKQRNSIVHQKIEMVKLEGMERRYPFQLSGGQQQRVALARALAIEPEVLLLDEPFSALDDHLRSQMVKQLMDTLLNYHGVTLFVTHNMEEAYMVCSKLVILMDGRVEAQGDKEKLFQLPPTLATAQLTGCKNFSTADFLLQDELEAVDWGVKLKTKDLLTKKLRHVGIRAHYIRLASENDKNNIFKCWPSFSSETPFRMTVYLSLGKVPTGPGDYQLQWEVSKEKWLELQGCPLPWTIFMDPEKLITVDR
jgi:ABC-type sulfate/molybdate transport systems ATPase subunit